DLVGRAPELPGGVGPRCQARTDGQTSQGGCRLTEKVTTRNLKHDRSPFMLATSTMASAQNFTTGRSARLANWLRFCGPCWVAWAACFRRPCRSGGSPTTSGAAKACHTIGNGSLKVDYAEATELWRSLSRTPFTKADESPAP